MRRLHHRIDVARAIAVALIVGEYEDHVGMVRFQARLLVSLKFPGKLIHMISHRERKAPRLTLCEF